LKEIGVKAKVKKVKKIKASRREKKKHDSSEDRYLEYEKKYFNK